MWQVVFSRDRQQYEVSINQLCGRGYKYKYNAIELMKRLNKEEEDGKI